MFPKSTGISKYFAPYTILKKRQIDYKKEFSFSFGNYIQAYDEHTPKNTNVPRSIETIYLCAEPILQDGHQVMDLATGRMTRRPKYGKCKMARLVIERVETLAKRQSHKTLKSLNGKHEEMILTDADLLKGVGGPIMKF